MRSRSDNHHARLANLKCAHAVNDTDSAERKLFGHFMADADPAAQLQAALLRVDSLIRREPFVTVRVAPAHEAALRDVIARIPGSTASDEAVASTIVSSSRR